MVYKGCYGNIQHDPNRSKAKLSLERKVIKANPEIKGKEYTILYNRNEILIDGKRFRFFQFKFCGLKPWEIDYTGLGYKRLKKD